MTLLIIYWTSATQWWLIAPTLAIFAFFFFRQAAIIDNKGGDNTMMVIPGVACCLFFIASVCVTFSNVAADNKEMSDALSAAPPVEECQYHQVEFLGIKPIQYNPSDGRRYVNMGTGEMISFNRIVIERMCRTCAQFADPKTGGDSIFVYKVQKDAPHWWNAGPVLYFSLSRDIFLEGSQSVKLESPESAVKPQQATSIPSGANSVPDTASHKPS